MNSVETYLLQQLAQQLLARDIMVVVAESCTGGGIANAMTSLPGSSAWFERGYVAYSNEAKKENLSVTDETLIKFGAVSIETAIAMADGALVNSHAEVSVAVTGIAGPDGGTEDKPVGTVCFAWAAQGSSPISTSTVFSGDRESIREQAILMALQGLQELVEKL
ncbi:MAG: nicotinamide-nucleotide amidase [Gammaproteobacteria bacterium]|jgi:nicotinamide-nucleotide amidase